MLTISEQRKIEINSCNFIKTLLMLSVVVYHSILFWSGKWFTKNPAVEAQLLALLSGWMNSFHIYGFTLVSGYIFFHVKYVIGRYNDYPQFLRTKAQRLLIPYVFAAVLWVIPTQCYFLKPSFPDIIKNYALGCSPSQLWFLMMLFVVFAIMWPLSDLVRRHDLTGGVIVAALYLIGLVGLKIVPNIFQIWSACKYCVFFWLGMKLCQHNFHALRRLPVWLWLVTHIALYVVVRLMPEGNVFLELAETAMTLLLNLIGALMSFMLLGKLAQIISWQKSRVFACLNKYSFPIYLFHQQIVFWSISFLNGRINPYVNALANLAFAIVGSLCISWILMRFKTTRILIGEKK